MDKPAPTPLTDEVIRQGGTWFENLSEHARQLELALIETRRELEEAIRILRDEVLEFVEGQEDVVDGSYGVPHANRAMQIAQELRAFLKDKP